MNEGNRESERERERERESERERERERRKSGREGGRNGGVGPNQTSVGSRWRLIGRKMLISDLELMSFCMCDAHCKSF